MLPNLLCNAERHAASAVRLTAKASCSDVAITVEDDGPGFAGDNPERFLVPFVSEGGHHGHGLGLAIVSRILERHSGTVRLGTSPMSGARVETVWSG